MFHTVENDKLILRSIFRYFYPKSAPLIFNSKDRDFLEAKFCMKSFKSSLLPHHHTYEVRLFKNATDVISAMLTKAIFFAIPRT